MSVLGLEERQIWKLGADACGGIFEKEREDGGVKFTNLERGEIVVFSMYLCYAPRDVCSQCGNWRQ